MQIKLSRQRLQLFDNLGAQRPQAFFGQGSRTTGSYVPVVRFVVGIKQTGNTQAVEERLDAGTRKASSLFVDDIKPAQEICDPRTSGGVAHKPHKQSDGSFGL